MPLKRELEDEITTLKNEVGTLKDKIQELEEDNMVGKITAEEAISVAKKLGLFKRNKSMGTYEIIVPINDYEKI